MTRKSGGEEEEEQEEGKNGLSVPLLRLVTGGSDSLTSSAQGLKERKSKDHARDTDESFLRSCFIILFCSSIHACIFASTCTSTGKSRSLDPYPIATYLFAPDSQTRIRLPPSLPLRYLLACCVLVMYLADDLALEG